LGSVRREVDSPQRTPGPQSSEEPNRDDGSASSASSAVKLLDRNQENWPKGAKGDERKEKSSGMAAEKRRSGDRTRQAFERNRRPARERPGVRAGSAAAFARSVATTGPVHALTSRPLRRGCRSFLLLPGRRRGNGVSPVGFRPAAEAPGRRGSVLCVFASLRENAFSAPSGAGCQRLTVVSWHRDGGSPAGRRFAVRIGRPSSSLRVRNPFWRGHGHVQGVRGSRDQSGV